MYGKLKMYVTVDRYTPESIEHGDAEERGWARAVGEADIYENRNYVSPIVDEWFSDGDPRGWWSNEDAPDYVRDALDSLGAYETDGNGTYYAADHMTLDYATGETFSYAIHAHVKHQDESGQWVETPIDVRDYIGQEN